jgi:D-3-phosphoglycerate dehydrogenase
MGMELREKTLGLLGLGKIGFEVARAASQGLLMRVIAHDPLVTPERAEQAQVELVDLETLIRESDVLSVHTPLNDSTRGIIGTEQLRAMKPTARVINVARGGIIDEEALAAAIRDGEIAGAAVDVFTKEPPPADHPLLQVPGVLVTPHLGASTLEAQINVAYDVADQIVAVLSGGAARYAVNAPVILPEEMAALQPYLHLAHQMGVLAAQMGAGQVREVVCTYTGELADRDTTVLTAEALRGLLARFTETRINPINARAVARQHSIEVGESRTSRSVDYANSMLLEVVGGERLSIAGTQLEGEAWITRVNGYKVRMRPEGRYLVGTNRDLPGVIAGISTHLARHDINIANFGLGRNQPRGHAFFYVEVDDPVPAEVLREMQATVGLESVREIQL